MRKLFDLILATAIFLFLALQAVAALDIYDIIYDTGDLDAIKQFRLNFDLQTLSSTQRHTYLSLVIAALFLCVAIVILTKSHKTYRRGRRYEKGGNHLANFREIKRITYLTVFSFFGKNKYKTHRSLHYVNKAFMSPFYEMFNRWQMRNKKPIREMITVLKGYKISKKIKRIIKKPIHGVALAIITLNWLILSINFNLFKILIPGIILWLIGLYYLITFYFVYFIPDDYSASGIPIVVHRRLWIVGKYSRIYNLASSMHTLFVGATRRGKSITYVIPMIFSYIFAGESFINHDPKHEIYAYTKIMLKLKKYKIIVLDWVNQIFSLGWNPLSIAWNEYKAIFIKYCEYVGPEVIKEKLDKSKSSYSRLKKIEKAIALATSQIGQIEKKYSGQLKDNQDIVSLIESNPQDYEDYKNCHDIIKTKQKEYKQLVESKNSKPQDILKDLVQFDSHALSGSGLSKAIEYTMDVADALTFSEKEKGDIWTDGAADMITGAALYHMEEAVLTCQINLNETELSKKYIFPKERYIHFHSIHNFYKQIKHINKIEEAIALLNRRLDADSIQKMANYITSPINTKGSFEATFNVALRDLIATPAIRSMTSESTFSMEDIFKEKTAVFLLTHDEKTTFYPLVSLFFKQAYEVAIRVTRENSDGRLNIPMNFVIDEMAMMPPIKDIQAMYGAAGSRGIRITAFIQSLEQLVLKYGERIARIIEDNCSTQIFLGSSSEETRQKWKDKLGKTKVWDPQKKKYEEKNIISQEEINLIGKGNSLIYSIENYPIIARLPMITEYAFWNKKLLSDMKPSEDERRENSQREIDFLKVLDKSKDDDFMAQLNAAISPSIDAAIPEEEIMTDEYIDDFNPEDLAGEEGIE